MTVISQTRRGELLERLQQVRANIESVFIGKTEAVSQVLIGLLARGHVLIEDVPGVGKTVLARAAAKSLDCAFSRIQLTPDLLPSDILGISIYNDKTGRFDFNRGPIFANIVLADEINRTTPRTQSALLEAMSESQATIDGRAIALDQPFMLIATQNPFEFEGTYFLPENQLDRFILRIRIGYPARESERTILLQQPDRAPLERLGPMMNAEDVIQLQELTDQVRVEDALLDYLQDIVEATRKHEALEVGVSPRGALSLLRAARAAALMAGRDYTVPDDFKTLVLSVFTHRLVGKSYVRAGHTSSNEQILMEILEQVPCPS